MSDFTKKAKETFDAKDGRTEEEKAKSVVSDLINKRLAALKIPPVGVEVLDDLGTRGAFDPATGSSKLDRLQFQPGKFHDLRDTTATIYHEARHAEQDFRVGQLLARQGKNAAQITAITGLNADVAQKAVDAKGDITAMQALIAQGWFDSLHGAAGIARRRRNGEELRASFRAREAACDAFKKDPTPKNRAAARQGEGAVRESRRRARRPPARIRCRAAGVEGRHTIWRPGTARRPLPLVPTVGRAPALSLASRAQRVRCRLRYTRPDSEALYDVSP